jgi:ketosteroid isomerase-like protein
MEPIERHSQHVLDAWNSQDVERVVACYTEDCAYLDPNTRGVVIGHAALRRYLSRLFRDWRMTWTLTESRPFHDQTGGAFLWRAELRSAYGGPTATVHGMDLVVVRDERIARNEVYFDRMVLAEALGFSSGGTAPPT